jgi:hypothetical protein
MATFLVCAGVGFPLKDQNLAALRKRLLTAFNTDKAIAVELSNGALVVVNTKIVPYVLLSDAGDQRVFGTLELTTDPLEAVGKAIMKSDVAP